MCVCAYVCLFVCLCLSVCVCLFVSLFVYVSVRLSVRLRLASSALLGLEADCWENIKDARVLTARSGKLTTGPWVFAAGPRVPAADARELTADTWVSTLGPWVPTAGPLGYLQRAAGCPQLAPCARTARFWVFAAVLSVPTTGPPGCQK